MSWLIPLMSRFLNIYVKIRLYIYIIIALYMSMFGITYVIVAIGHANIGQKPYVNITYEKFNIILL